MFRNRGAGYARLASMEVGFEARMTDLGDGVATVAVVGEADIFTVPDLKDALSAAIAGGAKNVLVDLSETTFVDSTALGVLIGAVRRLDSLGGTVAIACHDPGVCRIFEITRLDQVFAMFPDAEAALAYLRDPARAGLG